jgi:4'-phosphopantetheinyl transferase
VSIDIYRIQLTQQTARSGCADAALRAILTARGFAAEITRDGRGKPHVAGGPSFNISHSGGLALIAVCADGDLGVDLEQHRAMRDAATLARRYFTAAEADDVAAGDLGLFFRIWCRKEAWVKARGDGLYQPLNTVDVRTAPAGWLLEDVDVGPGYSAAVARPGDRLPIRVIDY